MFKNRTLAALFFFACIQFSSAQATFFTSFDGVTIAFSDEGRGEPILLLHGFINSKTSWDRTELKKDLLKKGYRVIVPDLRGNGASDKPQNEKSYQDDAEVNDIVLLMDYLKIKKYTAIGYSRGSIVLSQLLLADKRIKKAVLGGMGMDFTNPNWSRRLLFAKAFDGDVNEMTKGAVDYAKSIDADLRSLHLQQKYQPVPSKKELKTITVPILVIAGDKDIDNGDSELLCKVFNNCKLILVPGDHNGTYKTTLFSKEIIDFLD